MTPGLLSSIDVISPQVFGTLTTPIWLSPNQNTVKNWVSRTASATAGMGSCPRSASIHRLEETKVFGDALGYPQKGWEWKFRYLRRHYLGKGQWQVKTASAEGNVTKKSHSAHGQKSNHMLKILILLYGCQGLVPFSWLIEGIFKLTTFLGVRI